MRTERLLEEIRETNLNYLLLAQHLIREDKDAAMYRLGIAQDVADTLLELTTSQLLRIASSNTLLCRFRFDDRLILDLLLGKGRERTMCATHAAMLMTRQPVESIA